LVKTVNSYIYLDSRIAYWDQPT